MKKILLAVAAIAALSLMPSAAAATVSAAGTPAGAREPSALLVPHLVLVNQPARWVCVGNRFRVGVWYQQSSGGSRAYRVLVYNPSWKLIFYRHGLASSAAWKIWRIRAWRTGHYHTTYKTKNSSGQWIKYRTVTRSHRC
jgi:hypothetical protein